MTPRRHAFLQAARAAQLLLEDRAVEAAWGRPSALAEFTVSGLAGHLALQVLRLPDLLAADAPDVAPRTLLDHYVAADWVDTSINDPSNVHVRKGGEETARVGGRARAAQVEGVVSDLDDGLLVREPIDRVVDLPWARPLLLDDYLLTRMLEITVHSDDLAVSVGIPTPALPRQVVDPVLHLLVDVAVSRHGATAMLRALSRTERAPERINAI